MPQKANRTYPHPQAPQKHMNGQHRKTWTPSQSHASSFCLLAACETKLQPTHGSHIVPHALRSNRGQIPWCPFWGSIIRHSILALYCPSVFTTMPTDWRGKAASAARRALHLYTAFTGRGGAHTRGLHIHEWAGLCMQMTSTLFSKAIFCGLIIWWSDFFFKSGKY